MLFMLLKRSANKCNHNSQIFPHENSEFEILSKKWAVFGHFFHFSPFLPCEKDTLSKIFLNLHKL